MSQPTALQKTIKDICSNGLDVCQDYWPQPTHTSSKTLPPEATFSSMPRPDATASWSVTPWMAQTSPSLFGIVEALRLLFNEHTG